MEQRNQNTDFTFNQESRTVEGYGCVFESESEDLGFIEVIHRGAITEDTINNSDVFVRFNHDSGKILARSKNGSGSLQLSVDEKGLYYKFDAPKTSTGDELLEYLQRGDLCSSSFAFSVDRTDPSSEKWSKSNGVIHRDIYKINKLYDVAPCFQPAYNETSCSKRFEEVKANSDEIDAKMEILRKEIEEL